MKILIISILVITIGAVSLSSCRNVNKERAYEFYDKHVKNFPESNE